jgi:enoyl-CoA hydratase/carnithine racemase
MKELGTALNELDKEEKVKVILIASKVDKAFCAGANITEFTKLTFESQLFRDIFQEFELILSNLKKPIICCVNGFALGGGCELALSGDIIVCADNAKFGLPEIKLGLIPGIGGT